MEGLPRSCDILDECRPFRLNVPDGLWFIRAAAVMLHDGAPGPQVRLPRLIGSGWAVRARGGRMYNADVQLRAATQLDLPILLALPELDGPYHRPLHAAPSGEAGVADSGFGRAPCAGDWQADPWGRAGAHRLRAVQEGSPYAEPAPGP